MIPLLPTLSPHQYIKRRLNENTFPFPLNTEATRMRKYYFARNGVWEASDVLGLIPGDEALMPTYTSGIEVAALEARGIIPRFYRLTRDLAPDFKDARSKLSARTRLFYLIHYFGFPQPLARVHEFCEQHRLLFFEDNALGLLSADEAGKPLGSSGDVGLFCPRKTLPIPHGGMLVLNRPGLSLPPYQLSNPSWYSTIGETFSLFVKSAILSPTKVGACAAIMKAQLIPQVKKIMAERFGLKHTESGGPVFEEAKARWQMSCLSAALLPTFNYDAVRESRTANYRMLSRLLADLDGTHLKILFPHVPSHACPLEFMIVVDDMPVATNALKAAGIEYGLHWWWDRPQEIGSLDPNVHPLLTRGILLPIHQDLNVEDMKKIAEVIRDAVS